MNASSSSSVLSFAMMASFLLRRIAGELGGYSAGSAGFRLVDARRGARWPRPLGARMRCRRASVGRSPLPRRPSRLGGASAAALLLLERLGQAGHLRQRRLEQARGPGRQRLEGTGELGEQHLARLEIGDLVDPSAAEGLAVEHAALDDQQRVGLGEVAQALGGLDRIALDERDRGRAGEQAVVDRDAGIGRGPLGERVLDDRVGSKTEPEKSKA